MMGAAEGAEGAALGDTRGACEGDGAMLGASHTPLRFAHRLSPAVQAHTVMAKWAPPEHDNGAAVVGYELELTEAAAKPGGAKAQTVRLGGDACVHKLARLAATTTYLVRVRALSTAVRSPAPALVDDGSQLLYPRTTVRSLRKLNRFLTL